MHHIRSLQEWLAQHPEAYDRELPCPICDGTGLLSCPACDGDGYADDGPRCRTCHGMGTIICEACIDGIANSVRQQYLDQVCRDQASWRRWHAT